MWYRLCQVKKSVQRSSPRPVGLEEKLIRLDAERAVRERLYLKGDYVPDTGKVNAAVDRVVKKMQEQFNDLNTVRNTLKTEEMAPAVEPFVTKYMNAKNAK